MHWQLRLAVIENEIGEVSIDDALVEQKHQDMAEEFGFNKTYVGSKLPIICLIPVGNGYPPNSKGLYTH